MHPRKIDGSELRVLSLPDGRVFVDYDTERSDITGQLLSRGGPEHSEHFCRFEDYGLADGLVRCRKCGLVKHE